MLRGRARGPFHIDSDRAAVLANADIHRGRLKRVLLPGLHTEAVRVVGHRRPFSRLRDQGGFAVEFFPAGDLTLEGLDCINDPGTFDLDQNASPERQPRRLRHARSHASHSLAFEASSRQLRGAVRSILKWFGMAGLFLSSEVGVRFTAIPARHRTVVRLATEWAFRCRPSQQFLNSAHLVIRRRAIQRDD